MQPHRFCLLALLHPAQRLALQNRPRELLLLLSFLPSLQHAFTRMLLVAALLNGHADALHCQCTVLYNSSVSVVVSYLMFGSPCYSGGGRNMCQHPVLAQMQRHPFLSLERSCRCQLRQCQMPSSFSLEQHRGTAMQSELLSSLSQPPLQLRQAQWPASLPELAGPQICPCRVAAGTWSPPPQSHNPLPQNHSMLPSAHMP